MNKNVVKKIQLQEMHSCHQSIYQSFQQMDSREYDKQSHFFHGRYENIYVDKTKIAQLGVLLDHILMEAATYLDVKPALIKLGFWFNVMKPGDTTTRHCHDDLDEILSGVYYIHAPAQSGNLLIYTDETEIITPQDGMLLFFSPALDHEVLRNESSDIRLSIGFNACQIESQDSP